MTTRRRPTVLRDRKGGRSLAIMIEVPYFTSHTAPNGLLEADQSCQALWYYYVAARHTFEAVEDEIILEGSSDFGDSHMQANYKQLYTSIAEAYGVSPEAMSKHWYRIDKEAERCSLPLLPDEEKFRHHRMIKLETH